MLITSSDGQDRRCTLPARNNSMHFRRVNPFLFVIFRLFGIYAIEDSKLWRHTWLDITSSAWQTLSLHILSVYLNFVNIRRHKQPFFCKIIEEGWSIMYIWHPLLPTYLPQDEAIRLRSKVFPVSPMGDNHISLSWYGNGFRLNPSDSRNSTSYCNLGTLRPWILHQTSQNLNMFCYRILKRKFCRVYWSISWKSLRFERIIGMTALSYWPSSQDLQIPRSCL